MANNPNIRNSRVTEIAGKIRGACSAILETQDKSYELQDALNSVREANRNTRLGAMLDVAEMSAADGWTPREIEDACKIAAKGNSDDRSAKALATFVSEMKNCAHPDVRDQFPAMVKAATIAWDLETDAMSAATKDAPASTPLRKYRSRLYHLVVALAKEIKVNHHDFTTYSAVVAFAVENDPAFDATKVQKRLQAMRSQLQDLFAEFPHDDLATCANYLEHIKPEDLVAARNTLLASTANAGVLEPKSAPAPATVTPVVTEAQPADGAIDLDEILGDVAGDEVRMAA